MSASKIDAPRYGWEFWAGLVIGGALIVTGVRGAAHEGLLGRSTDLRRWFLGAGVVHDVLLAPVFVAVGLATRWLPDVARTPVRLALATSALLTVLTWPLVQGWGRRAANPSALPLDYGRNLLVTIGAVWTVTLIAVIVRLQRARA